MRTLDKIALTFTSIFGILLSIPFACSMLANDIQRWIYILFVTETVCFAPLILVWSLKRDEMKQQQLEKNSKTFLIGKAYGEEIYVDEEGYRHLMEMPLETRRKVIEQVLLDEIPYIIMERKAKSTRR